MVRAETTPEQAKIAAETGQALIAFACKSGGTMSADGPISYAVARPLIKLMSLVVADRVDAKKLQAFVNGLKNSKGQSE